MITRKEQLTIWEQQRIAREKQEQIDREDRKHEEKRQRELRIAHEEALKAARRGNG